MRKLIVMIFLVSLSTLASAQTQVDGVMESIRKNNKTLQAGSQFWRTQNIVAKTGNTPANPNVMFENLWGTPEGAGVQKDFSISQQFDFPTSYANRSRVANARIEQNAFLQRASAQDVLLDAKKLCLEIIYQNKKRGSYNRSWLFKKTNSYCGFSLLFLPGGLFCLMGQSYTRY